MYTSPNPDVVEIAGSGKKRRVSWGENEVAIVRETDFSAERESVIDESEPPECRVARVKAAHKARILARKARENDSKEDAGELDL